MTHQQDEDSASKAKGKPRFPTPPWEKNKPKNAPESSPAGVSENVPENVPADFEEAETASPKKSAGNVVEFSREPILEDVPAKKTPEEIAAEKEALRKSVEAFERKIAEKEATKTVPAQENVPAEVFEKLQKELAKTKEAYLRAVADFDNYRRRMNDERPKNMLYAKGDLARDLFPILDNFKLGVDAAEKHHPEAKEIIDGFSMIATQLKNALAQHGIVEINPVGALFDPNEHESLSVTPSADVPEDSVIHVHRVGYKIGDRLLRPASVVIAGKP